MALIRSFIVILRMNNELCVMMINAGVRNGAEQEGDGGGKWMKGK